MEIKRIVYYHSQSAEKAEMNCKENLPALDKNVIFLVEAIALQETGYQLLRQEN
jgi:hypothetical protein